jgi:undecaprenyl-diphosphatase
MTVPLLVAAAIQGIVEGVTEFLPVSSTGHLIVAGDWLGLTDERAKTFDIFIQLGAILAIVWIYRERFRLVAQSVIREPASRRFVTNLLVAFIPVAVVGVLIHHWIKEHLFTPPVVALGFIGGGIVILFIERWKPPELVHDAMDLQPRTALGIGLAQLLALIPGVSRSGATIMGGYALGLSRTAATEFSFFLAVPVLAAAAGFDLLRSLASLSAADIPFFAVGLGVAFVSAFVVVKAFLRYVAHHSFSVFAWYRIAFGLFLLWLYARNGFPAV